MSTLVYDFSKKRVRENGKVMDKFSIAFAIEHLDVWSHATIIMDVFSYAEMAKMFFDKLAAKRSIFGKPVNIIGVL